MFYLGRTQNLKVDRITEHGAFLVPAESTDDTNGLSENELITAKSILLPKKESADLKTGDVITAFVYKDSEDRPIATVTEPFIKMDEVKKLTVTDVNNVGAFLNWNLVKDLFLPYREQTYTLHKNDSVLVALYVDKSSRLCATMHVYDKLKTDSPYKKDDTVSGFCYGKIDKFGAFIAVDDIYSGMIPTLRLQTNVIPGTEIGDLRVVNVKEDGKLELTLNKKSYEAIDPDGEAIYKELLAAGGFLPYHDKTDPEIIRAKFGLSKNAFKRAIGHLFKEGKIKIEEDGISKV